MAYWDNTHTLTGILNKLEVEDASFALTCVYYSRVISLGLNRIKVLALQYQLLLFSLKSNGHVEISEISNLEILIETGRQKEITRY